MRSEKRSGSDHTICRHKVVHERRILLEIDCEGCKEDGALDDPVCRKGVISALKLNPNVEAVITSHYREIQYVDGSMEILESICKFLETMGKMSIRDPYAELFGKTDTRKKDHNPAICEACSIYPEIVFSELKDGMMTDLNKAYDSFSKITGQVMCFKPVRTECGECHSILSQDLVYLFNQMEDLRASILHRGFQIMI